MTPPPNLQELIDTVRADAVSDNELDQLVQASTTVSQLEEVGDALLGHFVDQCRRRGRSWSEISGALGVTKQAAHKRFSLGTPTLERLTDRARLVLAAVSQVARADGHNYVGTEHLLLALFEPSRSIAAQVLTEAGLSFSRVHEQLGRLIPPGRDHQPGDRPFTPRAKAALEAAVAEAVKLGHNYIGTEHLLLGLYADPDSAAARVLAALHTEEATIRAAIVEKLAGYTKN